MITDEELARRIARQERVMSILDIGLPLLYASFALWDYAMHDLTNMLIEIGLCCGYVTWTIWRRRRDERRRIEHEATMAEIHAWGALRSAQIKKQIEKDMEEWG